MTPTSKPMARLFEAIQNPDNAPAGAEALEQSLLAALERVSVDAPKEWGQVGGLQLATLLTLSAGARELIPAAELRHFDNAANLLKLKLAELFGKNKNNAKITDAVKENMEY